MRFVTLLAVLSFFVARTGFAQCMQADASAFALDAEVCTDENFFGKTDGSSPAFKYEWDFCSGDLANTPSSKNILSNTAFARARSVKFIEDNGNWYAFAISATANTLMRLDFGTDVFGIPTYTSLGNVGAALSSAFSFDMVKHGGVWHMLVANGGAKNIIRYSFTEGLKATPHVSVIENSTFSLAGPNYITITHDSDGYYAFVSVGTSLANSKVVVLKFESIDATPVFSEFNVTGLNVPRGISLVKDCGQWYGFLLSFNTNTLYRLNFGTSLLNTPTTSVINTSAILNQPVAVKIVNEKSKYYALIQNARTEEANAALYRINFGESILNSLPEASKLQFATLTGGGYALDVVSTLSKWHAFTFNLTTQNLVNIEFPDNCTASNPVQYGSKTGLVSYTSPGTYNVTLKASDLNGNFSATVKQITVTSKVAPTLEITTENVCVDHDVFFDFATNSSNVLASKHWTFGDGDESNDKDPKHKYLDAGNYHVELWVSNADGCENRHTKNVTIFDPPLAAFSIPQNTICTNSEVTFENPNDGDFDGLLSSKWYLNDELIANTLDFSHTFSTTAPATIRLEVGIPGCNSEGSVSLNNLQSGPAAEFTAVPACANEFVELINSSQGDISESRWWIDHMPADVTQQLMLASGDHDVKLEVIGVNGCSTVVNKSLEVYPVPVAAFSIDGPGLYCEDKELQFSDLTESETTLESWHWAFGQSMSAERHPLISFENSGSVDVILTVTDENGCRDEIEKNIEVLQAPVLAIDHGSLCIDKGVTFSSSTNMTMSSWSWQIADKKFIASKPTYTFRSAGNFDVSLTGTSINGCATTVNQTVLIYPAVNPVFTASRNCVNQETVLSDISESEDEIVEWNWKADNIFFVGEEINYTFNATGEYDVELAIVTASGCSFKAITALEVVDAPLADFAPSSAVSAPENEFQFLNTSLNSTLFQWDFGDGNVSTDHSPSHSFTDVGTYTVLLKASNDFGCSSSLSKVVHVTPTSPDVEILAVETTQLPDDSREISLVIQNKGNTILQGLKVDIDVSGAITLTETVAEKVMPLARFNMRLKYGVKVDKLEFICAEAIVENDVSPDDNRNCATIDSEKPQVLPLYPNPAIDDVAVEWLNSGGSDHTTLTVINQIGLIVQEFNLESKGGLNRQVIDLSTVEEGIYLIVIRSGSFVSTQRVILSH